MNWIAVAVDGPSGAGKSSVCKAVAKRLNYTYIDTGAMYRAIGYWMIQHNINLADECAILEQLNNFHLSFNDDNAICINGECVESFIRSEAVSYGASCVAKLAGVRQYCVKAQRDMVKVCHCIMDGRDIGSVVLPNAQVKIYLDASVGVRAKRRYLQNQEKGIACDLANIENDIKQRDMQDMNRKNSPLIRLDSAYYLNSSNLTFEQTVNEMIKVIEETMGKGGIEHD